MSRAIMLFVCALMVALVWLGLDLLGARTSLGVLSGTVGGDGIAALLALLYVAAWLACVLVAPVLAIAGVLQLLVDRSGARKH